MVTFLLLWSWETHLLLTAGLRLLYLDRTYSSLAVSQKLLFKEIILLCNVTLYKSEVSILAKLSAHSLASTAHRNLVLCKCFLFHRTPVSLIFLDSFPVLPFHALHIQRWGNTACLCPRSDGAVLGWESVGGSGRLVLAGPRRNGAKWSPLMGPC